ncbi:MAG: hypothetical protein GTN62_06350 [Gemmatimonadales bacterium]|nr:hypothetical protein [Gemmatimonadales bacterium]NIN11120.1 hypothetical protein [Gemmatimonadales bacterium]NIN49717.1 hypothetical protein [Gemmatimonadales bacterium]NIP07181.1 hypothetical protein [Gemmatimonadales bacterium]NIQ99573.1 hypothetical protein [Gemmatimonadales bacterium]
MAERKAFLLRVDPRVYDALERWARDELRSVNGQIEFILRRSLRQAGRMKRGEEEMGELNAEEPEGRNQ